MFVQQKIKILVIDDHPAIRAGLISMIQAYDEKFDVIGEASDPTEGLKKAQSLNPDVVITDIRFDNSSLDGIHVVRELAIHQPTINCLVITSDHNGRYMVEAFQAGAKAFLYKDADRKDYGRAIEAAFEGMTHFPRELAVEQQTWNTMQIFTSTELRIIAYLAKDFTAARAIAREFDYLDAPKTIDPRTIETHKAHINAKFKKLDRSGLPMTPHDYCIYWGIDYKNLVIHTKH